MENNSKVTIDDSSSSMYFSFNSTAAYKTVENANEISSMGLNGDEECDQNMTLEADEENPATESAPTVKKLSLGISPAKAIPKNILRAYMALSSTPTKAQLLRSVEVHRGSAAVVDVCDLGLAFLEAPEEINAAVSEDKENQPQESLDIIYSETSSEIVVSVIEKTPEEDKPVTKKVGFSNLPVLKSSGHNNIRGTPRVRRSIPKCEPDLISNRPSRIISKRMSTTTKAPQNEPSSDDIPKMLSSILKISTGQSSNKRKSRATSDNPFNLLGGATRMSIVKTTLNSPARRTSRKSVTLSQLGKNQVRQSVLPTYKRKSFVSSVATAAAVPSFRRSVLPSNTRKSMLPKSITSPKKNIDPLNCRKSMIPSTSSLAQMSRKSIGPKTSASATVEPHSQQNKLCTRFKLPTNLKDEFVCEVCSRKFRVFSLFETHKATHNTSATSAKQTFCSGNDKQCRYCDKKFAIAKALTNHLIQNCTKIPPGEKKKLLFPAQEQTSTVQPNVKLLPKSISNYSSCDTLSSNSTQLTRNQLYAKSSDSANSAMLPPLTSKLKKKPAHSGVYCTPTKQILCHICKTTFNNILDFTEHKLLHSNAQSDDRSDATKDSAQNQDDVDTDNTKT